MAPPGCPWTCDVSPLAPAPRPSPVRLAILGAGVFATDAYTEVLQEIKDVLLPRYVWSRSQAGAEKLACRLRAWATDVEAVWGEEGLCIVERAQDVLCCAIVLPIPIQPVLVKRMLSAGKHVLEEKPLAPTVQQAVGLLRWYSQLAPRHGKPLKPFWGVAENFRLEPVFAQGGKVVQGLGKLFTASVSIEVAMSPSNKYFKSPWRRDPSCPGAFITDAGVHYVAALGELVRRRVHSVSGHACHLDPLLPGPDALIATLTFDGVETADSSCPFSSSSRPSGSLQITFCAPANKMLWRIVCEKGVVEVSRGMHEGKFGYLLTVNLPKKSPEVSFFEFQGINAELRILAHKASSSSSSSHAAKEGKEHMEVLARLLSPVQATEDLAVIEACLESSRRGGAAVIIDRSRHEGYTF